MSADESGNLNSLDGAASVDRPALLRAEPLARREEVLVVRAVICLGCLARTLRADDHTSIQSHPRWGGTGSRDAAAVAAAAAGGSSKAKCIVLPSFVE
jgi:hypothetical protein